ncbi:ATP-binding protein [Methanosalsum natronophilum]|nr:ATP-binding protein [Methanosalsum natronophilum]MCS3924672.1 DNA helicase HerA-like ATPase [Methanosalsum natronophilum]
MDHTNEEYSEDEILAFAQGDDFVSANKPNNDTQDQEDDIATDMFMQGTQVPKQVSNSGSSSLGTLVTGPENLRITENESVVIIYVRAENRDNIKIGSYLVVPYPNNEKMFARVKELTYMQKYPSDDANELHSIRVENTTLDEEEFKLLAYLEPLCILYNETGTKLARRLVDKIPKPNTVATHVKDIDSIQTGLNIPNEGIFLGYVSVGGEMIETTTYPYNVSYYLQNNDPTREPLIFRHALICGSTGTGKTFVGKNIIRQFISDNVRYSIRDPAIKGEFQPCVVILDPQDEYSQIKEDNPEMPQDYVDQMNTVKIEHGGVPKTKTFTAKIGNDRSYSPTTSASNKEFTVPFEIVRSNHWLLHGAEMNENQIYGLERLINDYFNSKQGNYSYNDFIDFVTDIDNKKEYTEDTNIIHEATYDSIVRRIDNNHYRNVFDQGADKITDILDQIFVPGQVSLFPTEYISSTKSRDILILTLMTLIVDNKLKNNGEKVIKDTPIILTLDEAHRYLSNARSIQARAIVGKFTDAARQGRKESLGLLFITQDPQDIADTVMKQINTKIVLNLNNESAITSLQIPKKYEKRIPFLKRGQMIIHSPDNSDTVELIGLKHCLVNHF